MPEQEGLHLKQVELMQGDFRLSAEFALGAGARVAVLGPSGAGKSTLLGAIAGFLDPVAGQILWDGARIDRLAPGARPVAMLFQDGNLFPPPQPDAQPRPWHFAPGPCRCRGPRPDRGRAGTGRPGGHGAAAPGRAVGRSAKPAPPWPGCWCRHGP